MSEKKQTPVVDEELLQRIEEAARRGAKAGAGGGIGRGFIAFITGLIGKILVPAVVICLAFYMASKFENPLNGLFDRNEPIEDHDMTIENNGFLGYTVADFSDAILGKASQLKNLEVYSREISEITTLTQAGLGNLKVFEKTQLVTYHGTAIYTVDLGTIKSSSIDLDPETLTVIIYIPHSTLSPVNIPSENIEFGDVEKGVLALGDISIKPEELAKIETEAKNKMIDKLIEDNVQSEADRYALLSVLEIYQPIIKSVSPYHSVEVRFED